MEKNITGIILAGGKSTRMGTDKGFLLHNGISFTQHIINNLTPLVDELLIVSNNADYDVFNIKRIPDTVKNFGPVAGVHAGLKASKTDYNFVISCDSPKVDINVFRPLLKERNNRYDVVQYIANSHTTPLIALYHKKCLNVFNLALQNNIHQLSFVVKQLDTKTLIASDEIKPKIVNINNPKDLKKYNIC